MKLYKHLFLLFFCVQITYAQTHIYQHFGVDEGLPSSEVYDMYQDKEGYMWFATDKGLSRYNGYEFENFTTKDGLPDNTILDFYPQENGQVWCYSYHTQSLFYFDEVFEGFKNYAFNTQLREKLQSRSILKSVVVTSEQSVLVGGYMMAGFIEITEQGEVNEKYSLNTATENAYDRVNINLGLHTTTGLFFSLYHDYENGDDIQKLTLQNSPSSRLAFVPLNSEQNLLIDKKLAVTSTNGNIRYYETAQNPIGIKRINDDSFFVGFYNNGAEIRNKSGQVMKTFLPKQSVSSFLIDAEGGYWFSTLDDGVYYIKNPNVMVLTEDHISSLVKNHNNQLYAGYNNGSIAKISNKQTEILYEGTNMIAAIVELDYENNEILGYGDGYLYNYSKNTPLFSMTANKMPEHMEDPLITSAAHIFYKKKGDSLHGRIIDHIMQDGCSFNDEIFIGTSSGLFIEKNDSIIRHQPLDILKNRIDDIDISKKTNTMYMATQGAGVIIYGDSIYKIDKDNGLTNNIVSEVHIENDSTVWACTNTGLNRIVFRKNNSFDVINITKEDGLISNDIDDVEITNDTVWVATKRGLCFFKKDAIAKKESSKILSLTLKNVSVNNRDIDKEMVQLDYDKNNIEFTLQAVSLRNSNSIHYRYRLKEIDTTWTTTTNRKIKFPSLSPGNYTFQAKASLSNNHDEYLINYSFKVLPPFWERWWFYTICVLSFFGLMYLFFRIRVLTYNQDVFRELIRLAIKRLKRKEQFFTFRSNGEDFKIATRDILYVNSQGNYLDIVTQKKTYTIRCKIGNFIDQTPDGLEYLRIHRSYIVRIDQISSKGKNWVVIKDKKIPVGETYLGELENIHF